ncbi:hypothetical protein K443DRAFT_120688 [Laccaria amethystina LaAM-08-1]|uniref:Uncharacterized protein n=1 Tax=Laccaria amethystina LaAM-08-1 TaxID=1095629 RepID=A0A0C9WZ79_9AGAR|nr:hypothetical protein K443DRAFT_120688 [Laccaria amethystina LaAM-08-1]
MDICESDLGDCCGMSFPKKSSQGLCVKCSKLVTLEDGSLQYEQWKAYGQCESCGIAYKNLSTSKCGRCATSGMPSMPGDNTAEINHSAIEASCETRQNNPSTVLLFIWQLE